MDNATNKDVLKFICTLRGTNNHPNKFEGSMVDVFTSGGCYRLYELLTYAFPTAEAYFSNPHRNHIVTKIGNDFYDIKGKVKNKYLHIGRDNGLKLTEEDHKECRRWCY